jgi:hypothetical protein
MKKVIVKTEYKKEYFVEDVLHELYNEFACQPDLDYDQIIAENMPCINVAFMQKKSPKSVARRIYNSYKGV